MMLLKEANSEHLGDRQKCSDCNYQSRSKDALKKHFKIKHKELICPQCDFKGTADKYINKHIVQKNKRFNENCPLCDFKANSKKELQSHMEKKHRRIFK